METIRTMRIKAGLYSTDNVEARLGDDFYILDINTFHTTDYPFKIDAYGFFIGLQGFSDGKIDLMPYQLRQNTMFVNMPGQLLEQQSMSEDFHAIGVIMSDEFVRELGLPYDFGLDRHIRDNPFIELSASLREAMLTYFAMAKSLLAEERRFQRETLRHLTCAFFYGLGSYLYQMSENCSVSRNMMLMHRFINEVKLNFKSERKVQFYADRLCLTPKYLSTVIKECSGQGATEWIANFVIEEARALLKSTDMTIQQVSVALGFPSQSFFGKYFKRSVGVSPKEYRDKKES